jgi:uncharacterized integral membrane protein
MYYKLLFALVLLILVLLFIIQNSAMVEIHFLAWSLTMGRGLMVLMILLVGILVGWLGRSQLAHRRKFR